MVTENGMVMMTLGEYHSLNATKNKVEEIEKSNEMLRKAMIHLTGKGNTTDIKVSRSDFIKMHEMAVNEMFENNSEENDVYGYNITIHWHGMYCSCSDGATPSNYIIPAIVNCDEELDWEEWRYMGVKNLYGYTVDALATGIVRADNIEDAREKVKAAYKAYSDCYDEQRDNISVWKLDENSWFADNPDVIEIMNYWEMGGEYEYT